MKKRIAYIAHALSAETRAGIDANRREASAWVGFLAVNFEIAPVADWIILTGEWDETPANRERGLAIDLALVARCDELVMVGPRISSGMLLEARHMVQEVGGPVYDLTGLPREAQVIAQAWGAGRWFP